MENRAPGKYLTLYLVRHFSARCPDLALFIGILISAQAGESCHCPSQDTCRQDTFTTALFCASPLRTLTMQVHKVIRNELYKQQIPLITSLMGLWLHVGLYLFSALSKLTTDFKTTKETGLFQKVQYSLKLAIHEQIFEPTFVRKFLVHPMPNIIQKYLKMLYAFNIQFRNKWTYTVRNSFFSDFFYLAPSNFLINEVENNCQFDSTNKQKIDCSLKNRLMKFYQCVAYQINSSSFHAYSDVIHQSRDNLLEGAMKVRRLHWGTG